MQTARRLVKGPDTAKTSKKQFADLVCFVALGRPQTQASITLIGIPGWADAD